jgi:hypothetical protein
MSDGWHNRVGLMAGKADGDRRTWRVVIHPTPVFFVLLCMFPELSVIEHFRVSVLLASKSRSQDDQKLVNKSILNLTSKTPQTAISALYPSSIASITSLISRTCPLRSRIDVREGHQRT